MIRKPAPTIQVGIMNAPVINFKLIGQYAIDGEEVRFKNSEARIKEGAIELAGQDIPCQAGESVILNPLDTSLCRFTLRDVVIGIGFHWEQKEDQEFQGALKLMVSGENIQVVNIISLEDYLISVISSEMRGDSSPDLLKAHTIISRSWLLAQIEKQDKLVEAGTSYQLIHESDDEYIRWYDREDHHDFHVCADDHCQRYQGVTRAHNPEVIKAVTETTGEVLIYEGTICDARFSKCCGGVVEQFEYCWEPVSHPYLQRVDDNPAGAGINTNDLKVEANAERFIQNSPDAFCNTRDADLLKQVLNDYDQSSQDFYRWTVTFTQREISGLILEKSGIDFGEIIDLIPVERGESGRLVRLKVVGRKKELIIGKELEIRRWLSQSHLYSSAFIIEKQQIKEGIPGKFILKGAGWGHGVGLCQIGAAVMANKGYTHQEILSHYFVNSKLDKRYG